MISKEPVVLDSAIAAPTEVSVDPLGELAGLGGVWEDESCIAVMVGDCPGENLQRTIENDTSKRTIRELWSLTEIHCFFEQLFPSTKMEPSQSTMHNTAQCGGAPTWLKPSPHAGLCLV